MDRPNEVPHVRRLHERLWRLATQADNRSDRPRWANRAADPAHPVLGRSPERPPRPNGRRQGDASGDAHAEPLGGP